MGRTGVDSKAAARRPMVTHGLRPLSRSSLGALSRGRARAVRDQSSLVRGTGSMHAHAGQAGAQVAGAEALSLRAGRIHGNVDPCSLVPI